MQDLKFCKFNFYDDRKHLHWNFQVMEDDSDEADDIPTIKVGGEEYEITDVTHEIIARYKIRKELALRFCIVEKCLSKSSCCGSFWRLNYYVQTC